MKIRWVGVWVLALLLLLILYPSHPNLLQAQEGDALPAGQAGIRFTVIGDFGSGNQDEQDVVLPWMLVTLLGSVILIALIVSLFRRGDGSVWSLSITGRAMRLCRTFATEPAVKHLTLTSHTA